MPQIRILSVGQCGFDTARIEGELESGLGAEVVSVATHAQARAALRQSGFDLVLVNRVGDRDGAPGLALISAVKADPQTADVPVMLVSNYADAQAEAVQAGAVPGFGKADLGTRRAVAAIEQALSGARTR